MSAGAVVFLALYLLLTSTIGINLTVVLGVIHLVIVPLIFKYSKTFQQQLVFLNYVQWPIHSNFSDPSQIGIEGGRNFYLTHVSKVGNTKINIGVWHILPRSVYENRKQQIKNCTSECDIDDIFNYELAHSGQPVIMYCHGNANHRAAHHRVKLYQVLQEMNVHVVAFDYRGYGDSSFVLPTESGVVEDSLIVYAWLQGIIDNDHRPSVYVWGHSLGSGIASHLLGNLRTLSRDCLGNELEQPDGLILESPFNNLRDEVDAHFMTVMVRWLPYFETSFVRPFSCYPHYEFRSDLHLTNVRELPILILHAKDDYVVPYRLGVKLHGAVSAARARGDAAVRLHTYAAERGLGHTWICLARDLPAVVTHFMMSCSEERNASRYLRQNSTI